MMEAPVISDRGVKSGPPAERAALLEGLPALLTYPRADFRATLSSLLAASPADSSIGEALRAFDAGTAALSPGEMEELYTRTFDLNPAASLETGWQLYGEAYERGAFLVKMRSLLRTYGVAEGGELPDHLASILLAMGRMPAGEAGGLASSSIVKAVGKMIAAFPDDGNPYLNLLKAALLTAEGMAARKESERP